MTHLIVLALLSAAPPELARHADDLIERLATCQSSWRDWKDDPVQSKRAAEVFSAAFGDQASDGSFTPKQKVTVVGLPVLQVYPESVGMGVGFSVVLEATFEDARAHTALARPPGRTSRPGDRRVPVHPDEEQEEARAGEEATLTPTSRAPPAGTSTFHS